MDKTKHISRPISPLCLKLNILSFFVWFFLLFNVRVRTEANARDSDGTLILVTSAVQISEGTQYTIDMCVRHKRPYHVQDITHPSVCNSGRHISICHCFFCCNAYEPFPPFFLYSLTHKSSPISINVSHIFSSFVYRCSFSNTGEPSPLSFCPFPHKISQLRFYIYL